MRVKLLKALMLFCFALMPFFFAQAKTSVWKVSNKENVFYLGGTVHVLSAADYPLPCEYELAFTQADEIIFETDIAALSAPSFALKAAQTGTYPAGTSLRDKISPETLESLNNYLNSIGLPAFALMQLKPGMLMSMIVLTELQKQGVVSSAGVDQYFYSQAKQKQKLIGQLESPELQLELVANLGLGNEDIFIKYLLESMNLFQNEFGNLLDAWRTGNVDALSKASGFDQLKNEFPTLFDDLISDRNNDWLSKIEKMAATPEVEYILVGALHMVGEEGLLFQLAEKSYTITQLDGCSL